MPLFNIVIHKSQGGRESRDQWSNGYHVRTDALLESPEMLAIINKIVDAEKYAHLSETHFMRAHVKQLAQNRFNAPADEFRTVDLSGTGARQIVAIGAIIGNEQPVRVNPSMAKGVCFVVNKNATRGRNGRGFYRNVLLMDDCINGLDGSFVLRPFEVGSTLGIAPMELISKLNEPLPNDAVFVMPNVAGLLVQTSRDVDSHSFGGISLVKPTRNRRSIAAGQKAVHERELNEYARKASRLLKGLLPGALTGYAATEFAALLAGAQGYLALLPAAEAAELALPLIFLL